MVIKIGTAGSDTLTGTSSADRLEGRGGNDRLNGLASNDTLKGEAGNDTLDGGVGNDRLDGGLNTDTALYSSAGSTVKVDLHLTGAQNTGGSGFDTLLGIENLTGSNFSDALRGNDSNNTLNGGSGNDVLISYGANDSLSGAAGNDTLDGGTGNDRLDGGLNTDTALYSLAGSTVIVDLRLTGAQNTGGSGFDTLLGIENLTGSNFSDALRGNDSNNTLDGGSGHDTVISYGANDSLSGADGDDYLDGGTGFDTLVGGSGNDYMLGSYDDDILKGEAGTDTLLGEQGSDLLYGGLGVDQLVGGDDYDYFLFGPTDSGGLGFGTTSNEADTITDFQDGVDLIALQGYYEFAGNTSNPREDQYGIWQNGDNFVVTWNTVVDSGFHDVIVQGGNPTGDIGFF